jgi:transcriptional regulator GlxA family with amidase domain
VTIAVAIFVFDDVEVLDFAGPYEVFTTASRVYRRTHPSNLDPFQVFTVGRTGEPVRARAGLLVHVDYSFHTCPPVDLLVVPGGIVTRELANPAVVHWIERTSRSSQLTASVCTGAFLLARAGLLSGRSAVTHWEDSDELRTMFPSVHVETGKRWVDAGAIVTSAGISAGIDMSLHLVERTAGRELALQTARQMEFTWTENS